MDIKGRLAVILLVILMLVSLSAAGMGFYLYQKEHAKNIELEEKIEELSTKQKATEAKLLEAENTLSSLEIKFKEASSHISDLTNELSQEKASKAEVVSNLEQIKSDLEQQKGLRLDLENKLNQARDKLRSMRNKLDALESERKNLESKVKDLESNPQGVELGKIVVSPEVITAEPQIKKTSLAKKAKEAVLAEKPIEGKVLVVNKEYNFVVINLGSRDGVGLGQVFSISRGNNYIGDVKIEKLHDSMAGASFLSDEIKDKIKEGDKVVKRAK